MEELGYYEGEIIGMSLFGMIMIVDYAYLAIYESADAELEAFYEFKYNAKRRAKDVGDIWRDKRGGNFQLYIERKVEEGVPPPQVRAILDKAKAWKLVSIAHPWSWI
jgi:hypothetical protein